MKISLLPAVILLTLIMGLNTAQAQYVTIPDTTFAKWLHNNGYNQCMQGNQLDTTCTALANVRALFLWPNTSLGQLVNLDGIQYFKDLDTLYCNAFNEMDRGNIRTIPALPPHLVYLDCHANNINALPALPQSLTFLFCCINNISVMPALPNGLKWFACNMNHLTSFTSLPDSLQYFDPDDNQLSTLPPLPNGLKELECYNNLLTSLPPLPASLRILNADSNLLTSVPALPDSMSQLILTRNNSLHCLPELTNIGQLDIDQSNFECVPNYGHVTNCNAALGAMMLCSNMGQYNPCTAATGVTDITKPAPNFSILPNPTSGSTVINVDPDITGATLSLTDVTGRVLMSTPLQTAVYQLQTSNLATGVYLLQLTANGQRVVKELVRE